MLFGISPRKRGGACDVQCEGASVRAGDGPADRGPCPRPHHLLRQRRPFLA